MPRKRLPEDERKVQFNIRLPKKLIDAIKQHKGYTRIIENLLYDFFMRKKD